MNNKMISSAEKTQFKLFTIIFLAIAYFIYIIGEVIGGTIFIELTNLNSFFRINREFVSLATCFVSSILLFLWVKFVELREIKGLGFYKKRLLKDTVVGSAVGIGSFSLILLISKLLGIVSFLDVNLDIKNIFLVILIIPFWFLQAGAEEILTRGFVLPMVSANTNKFIGVLASSLMFVLLHMSNFGLNLLAVVNIFLVGVLLSIYTLLTDNIWGSIAFHAFWNFTQGTFFGLAVSGSRAMEPRLMSMMTKGDLLLSGGTFGIEASIINTAVVLILIAIVADKYHRQYRIKSS